MASTMRNPTTLQISNTLTINTMSTLLHYYNFADGVTTFTTTRHGGFSKGNFATLNINPHRGDDPSAVEKNLQAVATELSLPSSHIIRQHQVHETDMRLITDAFFNMPEGYRQTFLEGVDGVFTDESCVCVGVFTADCIPLLFYDSEHRAVGAAHAGWRGTVKRIGQKAISYMKDCFGTSPADVKALIGPGITVKNFEVGQEVYDEFSNAGFDMKAIACKYPTMNPKTGDPKEKWHIDLPECNRQQLIDSGVRAENIIMTGIDTYDNADEYFSARRLKKDFGTMFTGLFIH